MNSHIDNDPFFGECGMDPEWNIGNHVTHRISEDMYPNTRVYTGLRDLLGDNASECFMDEDHNERLNWVPLENIRLTLPRNDELPQPPPRNGRTERWAFRDARDNGFDPDWPLPCFWMVPALDSWVGYDVPVVACVYGHERVRGCIAAGMTAPVLCDVYDSRVQAEMAAAVHLIECEDQILSLYNYETFGQFSGITPDEVPVLPSCTDYSLAD